MKNRITKNGNKYTIATQWTVNKIVSVVTDECDDVVAIYENKAETLDEQVKWVKKEIKENEDF